MPCSPRKSSKAFFPDRKPAKKSTKTKQQAHKNHNGFMLYVRVFLLHSRLEGAFGFPISLPCVLVHCSLFFFGAGAKWAKSFMCNLAKRQRFSGANWLWNFRFFFFSLPKKLLFISLSNAWSREEQRGELDFLSPTKKNFRSYSWCRSPFRREWNLIRFPPLSRLLFCPGKKEKKTFRRLQSAREMKNFFLARFKLLPFSPGFSGEGTKHMGHELKSTQNVDWNS